MSVMDLRDVYRERSMVYLQNVLCKDMYEPWIPKIIDHMAEQLLYIRQLEHTIERMKKKKTPNRGEERD